MMLLCQCAVHRSVVCRWVCKDKVGQRHLVAQNLVGPWLRQVLVCTKGPCECWNAVFHWQSHSKPACKMILNGNLSFEERMVGEVIGRFTDRQCKLFALYACAEAVGGEASTIEDLGEGPDNVERYRKTVQPLVTVQGVWLLEDFWIEIHGRSLAGQSLERPKADADQLTTKCFDMLALAPLALWLVFADFIVKNCLQLAHIFAVFCIFLELKMPTRPSMIKWNLKYIKKKHLLTNIYNRLSFNHFLTSSYRHRTGCSIEGATYTPQFAARRHSATKGFQWYFCRADCL